MTVSILRCPSCGNTHTLGRPLTSEHVSEAHTQVLIKAPAGARFTTWGSDAVFHFERGKEKESIMGLEEWLANLKSILMPLPPPVAVIDPPAPVIHVEKEILSDAEEITSNR